MTGEDILSVGLTGIVTVAIVAVIFSRRSKSPQLISGFFGTLSGVIKAAVGQQGQSWPQPQINPAQGIGTPAAGLAGVAPGAPGLQ